MDILEELDIVRNRLKAVDCKVDPNEVFAELEQFHTNKPRAPSENAVQFVVDLFVRRAEDTQRKTESPDQDDQSVISLNDSESAATEQTIDLTGTLDSESELNNNLAGEDLDGLELFDEDPVRRGLLEDTKRVLRIIRNDGLDKGEAEVLAYLENYVYDPHRVQIVVEELVGVNNDDGHFKPEEEQEEKYKGKGKGVKGIKFKNRTARDQDSAAAAPLNPGLVSTSYTSSAKRPSVSTAGSSTSNHKTTGGVSSSQGLLGGSCRSGGSACQDLPAVQELSLPSGAGRMTFGSHAISPDLGEEGRDYKRKGSTENIREQVKKVPRVERVNSQRQKNNLEEDMLHGPFDFKAHRSKEKVEKKSSNLRPELDSVVAEVSGGRWVGRVASRAASVEVVEDSSSSSSTSEPPDIPTLTGHRPTTSKRMRGSSSGESRPPSPVFAAKKTKKTEPETADNRKEALVENLSSMFPDTALEYLTLRAEDLVGRPAALDRFTEELLRDPHPPRDWRRMYSIAEDHHDVILVDHAVALPVIVEPRIPSAPQTPATTPEPDLNTPASSRSNTPQSVATPTESRAATPKVPGSRVTTPNTSRASTPKPSGSGKSRPTSPLPGPSNLPEVEVEEAAAPSDPLQLLMKEKEGEMYSLFPDLSPEWILDQINEMINASANGAADFSLLFQSKVESIFNMGNDERKLIPTFKDWEKKQKENQELLKWTNQMTAETMLELFEDPIKYFNDEARTVNDENYKVHCSIGLRDLFRYHSNAVVDRAFRNAKGLFTKAYHLLKGIPDSRKTKRGDHEVRYPSGSCIQFLKEKKYVELEDQIKAELNNRQNQKKEMLEAARSAGLLKECLCCFSDECLEIDMIFCNGNHMFCKECVSRGANVAMGDAKTVIECLGHCSEEITWVELQRALSPNVLSKLLQKRQAQEVATAGLEGLVSCPFCPYLTIMENENDKVLACKNPECGRESCRLCKKPNHVPLRCKEAESNDEDIVRKKVEEQLTQAMIRECYKCATKFFKEEGCNKMTCPKCGAKMCYLCKQQVENYEHFYGQGGSPSATKKCALWTDTASLHQKEVAIAAEKAREFMAENKINLSESADPTKGIPDSKSIVPRQNNVPGLFNILGGHPNVIRNQRIIEQMIQRNRNPNPEYYGLLAQRGGAAPPDYMHNMVARMGEIYRLREEGRMQQRLARRAEIEALRDLRINQWIPEPPGAAAAALPRHQPNAVAAPAAPVAAPAAPLPPAQGLNPAVLQQMYFAPHVHNHHHHNPQPFHNIPIIGRNPLDRNHYPLYVPPGPQPAPAHNVQLNPAQILEGQQQLPELNIHRVANNPQQQQNRIDNPWWFQ